MRTTLILVVICEIVLLITAMMRGAYYRVLQHQTTLGSRLPKWWPSQKHLWLIAVIFSWILTLGGIATAIYLMHENQGVFMLIALGVGGILWLLGKFLGMVISSAVIRKRAKKDGIDILPECFGMDPRVYLEDFFKLIDCRECGNG